MAQLGFFEITVLDSAGAPVSGASVEVRKQGAFIQSGGPTSFTVDDPGALAAADTVQVNTSGPLRSVSSVTATNVTIGGAGFGGTADDDRITCTTSLPTIYNDAQGNESKTNPLTTDSNGYAYCWAIGGKYDVLLSGAGITTRLLSDVVFGGGEQQRSNAAAGPAWVLDTLRTLPANDKILSVREATVEKFGVDDDGDVNANNISAAAISGTTGTFSGAVSGTTGTFSSTLAVTSTSTFSDNVTISGATKKLVASRLELSGGTALVIGDFAIDASWGAGASISVGTGSTDTQGSFTMTAAGTPTANPIVDLTFKDGAFASAPHVMVTRVVLSIDNQPTIPFTASPSSATQVRFQWAGTPVAGQTYTCRYWIVGDKS